jgi:6-phosphogluconolactonase (cycloisomerase 2 family)
MITQAVGIAAFAAGANGNSNKRTPANAAAFSSKPSQSAVSIPSTSELAQAAYFTAAKGANGLEERKDAVLSTLPLDVAKGVHEKNSTAEVLIHPDNGHVLVSNRGHDSIAVFKVNADSTTPIGHITSAGDREIRTPRKFNIDPTGKLDLIASLDGGNLQVAQWDGENGKLTGSKAMVKKPMCVKFLAKP